VTPGTGKPLLTCVGLLVLTACGQEQSQNANPDPASITEIATIAASCSGCHAPSGTAIPSLSGRSAEELETLMLEYRHGDGTTVMHLLARAYSDDQIASLSAYLAEAPAP
jgi:sulfide dehydrogenase cytochrome subunit